MRKLLLATTLITFTAPAAAQDSNDEELALALAKVCVNESGFTHRRECDLIWQTVRGHGDTSAERLAWLTAHSNCVLTDRPMTEREAQGNCRWSRHLAADDTEPNGWYDHLDWERFVSRWQRIRVWAWSMVLGARPQGGWPCESTPHTWGGIMDRPRALRAGMRPVRCAVRAAGNSGYLYPGK